MTEIFRYLRPKNSSGKFYECGGLAFLLLKRETEYDYWVYICPNYLKFSKSHAVRSLRQCVSSGVAPWASIQFNDAPLISSIIKSMTSDSFLQADAAKMVLEIAMNNWSISKNETL